MCYNSYIRLAIDTLLLMCSYMYSYIFKLSFFWKSTINRLLRLCLVYVLLSCYIQVRYSIARVHYLLAMDSCYNHRYLSYILCSMVTSCLRMILVPYMRAR